MVAGRTIMLFFLAELAISVSRCCLCLCKVAWLNGGERKVGRHKAGLAGWGLQALRQTTSVWSSACDSPIARICYWAPKEAHDQVGAFFGA